MQRVLAIPIHLAKITLQPEGLGINYEVLELNMGGNQLQLLQIELKHVHLKYMLMDTISFPFSKGLNFSLINDKQSKAGSRLSNI